MDLTRLLLRAGAARPHVLLLPVPGGTSVRLAVEAELARRGWPLAQSPADADVLVVAGRPGPRLSEIVEAVWHRLPAPRARIELTDPADVGLQLDAAAAVLANTARQRARQHHDVGPVSHHAHEEHGEHGGHEGHGDMGPVAGLPMADLGEDRDGLTLDRVHVPLGPLLPDWPPGLVVRVTLQGDVVQEAEAEVVDGPAAGEVDVWAGRAAARELDALARFLGVAGWDDAADRARRLRDDLLSGAPDERHATQVRTLVRRVRRSRALRWLLRGLAAGDTDVGALLERRLAAVERAVRGPDTPPSPPPDLAGLARALVGADLATLRLIVAALDPDTEIAPARVPHG